MTFTMRQTLHLVLVSVIMCAIGCASTAPPVAPDHPITDNPLPVYSCPEPPELPPLVLPAWPVLPDDPTADDLRTWYVEMVRVVDVRLALLAQRVDALDEMLDAYRR